MIRKIYTTTILFIFSISFSYAQNDFKYWDSGKLSWRDFKIKEDTINGFGLEYHIETKVEDYKKERITIRREVAKVYLLRHQLWVHSSQKTDENLKYLQLLFDIGELHRKKLQQVLDSNIPKADVDLNYLELQQQFYQRTEQFKAETQKGKNIEEVKKWASIIHRESSGIKLKVNTDFKEGNGSSFSLAYPVVFFSGNEVTDFAPLYVSLSVPVDFILGRNRINAAYGFSFGINKKTETIPLSIQFLSLDYGFEVIKTPYLRLYPTIGGMVGRTSYKNTDDETRSFGFRYGIETEFLLNKLVVTSCDECRNKRTSELWLGLGYTTSKLKFLNDKSGNAHFITLSIKRIRRNVY
jgi:hypothetical protein